MTVLAPGITECAGWQYPQETAIGMMVAMATTGENLKAALHRQGISVPELAAALGVSRRAVYAQLDGENPRLQTLQRYTDALNEILAERGDPRRWSVTSLMAGPEPEPMSESPPPIPMRPDLAATFANGGGRIVEARDEPSDPWVEVPILGTIPCGKPLHVEEAEPVGIHAVHWSQIPRGVKPADCFALIARGDSMRGAGIDDGDVLVFRVSSDLATLRDRNIIAVRADGDTKCCAVTRIGGELRPVSMPSTNPSEWTVLSFRELELVGVRFLHTRQD